MIRITPEGNQIYRMEIKLQLPFDHIAAFLHKRGYEVKPWLWIYEDESFPNGKTYHESWTFTATKNGGEQSEKSLYLSVFETEMKELLKEF